MNCRQWNERGYCKRRNPSGEIIRTKTYERKLIAWDNEPNRSIVAKRKKLAELLGVPWYDLLADLEIKITIERYPKHRRFLKFWPKQLIKKQEAQHDRQS